jgi:hypothetical protein
LQWFRFLSPERLAIDIENRKNQESLAKKKQKGNKMIQNSGGAEKMKVEGIKRKKRRMKFKAKGNNDAIIEKFSA